MTTTPPTGLRAMRDHVGLAYFPISALARLPISMLGLGSLTYAVASADQFATAGTVSAFAGLGVALGAPLSGAASDRWGQRVTLLVATVAHALALLGLLAVIAPTATPLTLTPIVAGAALLAGATAPQCGPMTRVRWIRRLAGRDPHTLETAQGYESTVDELGFVFGPASVGIVAVLAGPAAPLWASLVLTLLMVPAFALHRSSAFAAGHRDGRHGAAGETAPTPWGAIALLLLGMLSIGTVFGSLATTTTVFVEETGHADIGGVIYAAMGLTSGAAALSVSRWPTSWSAGRRWVSCATALLPALALLWLAAEPWHLGLLLLLVGAPIGPVLVTVFHAAGTCTPARRLGLVMTLLSAGITLGTSLGNWLGGALADAGGHRASLWVTFGAGGFVLAFGLLFALRSRGRSERGGRLA
ncbi:MAG: MFS transporter [Arachnia sp.]